jgi:hypothetical protein
MTRRTVEYGMVDRTTRSERAQPRSQGGGGSVPRIGIWLTYSAVLVGALLLLLSYRFAVHPNVSGLRYPFYWAGMLIAFLPVAIQLTARSTSKHHRVILIVLLGVITYIPKLLRNPSQPVFSDELLHWYQQTHMIEAGSLFVANPVVAAIGHYPGYDAVVVGVHLIGIPLWPADLLVVGVSHIALLLGVATLAFELTRNERIASSSAMIYSAGPAFSSFTVLASYEVLGLPLAVWALVMAVRVAQSRSVRSQMRSFGFAIVLIIGTGVTHPLSAVFLFIVLLAFALAGSTASMLRIKSGPTRNVKQLWGLTGSAALFDVLWAVGQRWNPLPYLLPSDVSLLPGTYSATHVPFQSSGLPSYETFSGLVAPLIITGLAIVGFLASRRHFDRYPEQRWALAALYIIYPLTFLGELNGQAGSEVHRSWPFLYVCIVPLAAIGAIEVLYGGPCVTPKALRSFMQSRIIYKLRRPILFGAITLLLIGNTANDSADADRFPGPWRAGSSRDVTPELIAASQWLRTHATPGTRILADKDAAYEFLATAWVVPQSGIPIWQLTETTTAVPVVTLIQLYTQDIKYIEVDERMTTSLNARGYWYSDADPTAFSQAKPFPPAAVNKLESEPWAIRAYRSENYSIYMINRKVLLRAISGGPS